MRDHNVPVVSQLPPANHAGGTPISAVSNSMSALFLEDWPVPAKCAEEDLDTVSMNEVRKWRLQALLAVSPFGVPTLALPQAYEKMFGRKFDLRDYDCDTLDDLIKKMADILIVQQPSSTTAILYPDYPHDKVLHDIRLGLDFSKQDFDDDAVSISSTGNNKDFNALIYQAWLERDQDFPPDVVLIGEPYEQLLKISLASVAGSRGLYRASLVRAASPESLCIRLKSGDENISKIRELGAEIGAYFKNSNYPIDAYNVPKEFISPDFPCLLYSKERAWERCVVIGGASGGKVLVECVDFGGVYAVHLIFLYLIPRKFLEIPRQTLAVSLIGLKPTAGNSEWHGKVGARMRCFSIADYWLDVLLIEQKERKKVSFRNNNKVIDQQSELTSINGGGGDDVVSIGDSKSSADTESASDNQSNVKKRYALTQRVSYDAIIVDRNHDELDIFMDELLILETYAEQNIVRMKEVMKFKAQLKEAFKSVPRPENPLANKDILGVETQS